MEGIQLTRNHFLEVGALGNYNTSAFKVVVTYIVNGELNTWAQDFLSGVSLTTFSSAFFPFTDGIIIGVQVYRTSAASAANWIFCRVRLCVGSGAGSTPIFTFVNQMITVDYPGVWPAAGPQSPDFLGFATVFDTAATVTTFPRDYTVPGGVNILADSIYLNLVTDATVADRLVVISGLSGTSVLMWSVQAPIVQAASLNMNYSFIRGISWITPVSPYILGELPDFILRPTFKLRLNIHNFQAGDQCLVFNGTYRSYFCQ